jgi:translation elongation factor EF-Tu-like GTPase
MIMSINNIIPPSHAQESDSDPDVVNVYQRPSSAKPEARKESTAIKVVDLGGSDSRTRSAAKKRTQGSDMPLEDVLDVTATGVVSPGITVKRPSSAKPEARKESTAVKVVDLGGSDSRTRSAAKKRTQGSDMPLEDVLDVTATGVVSPGITVKRGTIIDAEETKVINNISIYIFAHI